MTSISSLVLKLLAGLSQWVAPAGAGRVGGERCRGIHSQLCPCRPCLTSHCVPLLKATLQSDSPRAPHSSLSPLLCCPPEGASPSLISVPTSVKFPFLKPFQSLLLSEPWFLDKQEPWLIGPVALQFSSWMSIPGKFTHKSMRGHE